MRVLLRALAAKLLPRQLALKIKSLEFRLNKRLVKNSKPYSLSEMRGIVTSELGIRRGDCVMLHGSFSLLNFSGSPDDLIDLVLDVIGPEGHLAVPTFCAGSSVDFLESGSIFSAVDSKSGMGAVSEALRVRLDARRSLHPTKSVAVIGPRAAWITADHHRDRRPFGPHSPFARLVDCGVRVIGIGVSASYLSLVHVVEESDDFIFPRRVNMNQVFTVACIDANGTQFAVETYAHDLKVVAKANPHKFCERNLRPENYVAFRRRYQSFFRVDGRALLVALSSSARQGSTIYS